MPRPGKKGRSAWKGLVGFSAGLAAVLGVIEGIQDQGGWQQIGRISLPSLSLSTGLLVLDNIILFVGTTFFVSLILFAVNLALADARPPVRAVCLTLLGLVWLALAVDVHLIILRDRTAVDPRLMQILRFVAMVSFCGFLAYIFGFFDALAGKGGGTVADVSGRAPLRQIDRKGRSGHSILVTGDVKAGRK
jgi:hypothetical protein